MFYSTAIIIASLASAIQALQFDFDSAGLVVQEGVPLTLKWSGADGPVTLTLENGASDDLKEVDVIAADITGGTFTWTPEGIPSDTYAFKITDNSDVNYTPQFTYQSTGVAPTTAAETETATETETSTASDETETATSEDTTMTTMTTTGSSNSTMSEPTSTSTATDDDEDEDEETATATSDDDEADETGSAEDAEETDILNANSSGRIGASLSVVAGLVAMITLFN